MQAAGRSAPSKSAVAAGVTALITATVFAVSYALFWNLADGQTASTRAYTLEFFLPALFASVLLAAAVARLTSSSVLASLAGVPMGLVALVLIATPFVDVGH